MSLFPGSHPQFALGKVPPGDSKAQGRKSEALEIITRWKCTICHHEQTLSVVPWPCRNICSHMQGSTPLQESGKKTTGVVRFGMHKYLGRYFATVPLCLHTSSLGEDFWAEPCLYSSSMSHKALFSDTPKTKLQINLSASVLPSCCVSSSAGLLWVVATF